VRRACWHGTGVKIIDDRAQKLFPMPIDASGQDDVLVGRIREGPQRSHRALDLDVRAAISC